MYPSTFRLLCAARLVFHPEKRIYRSAHNIPSPVWEGQGEGDGLGDLGDERVRVNPIVVMGVSGCGKTTVGRALAGRLNATFLDADDFHPADNVARMRAGTPLTDADRAPWLLILNGELRKRSEQGESVVLACSALKASYRVAISAGLPQLRWIFLNGSFELIAARLRERANHYMPESLLRSQFAALERPDNAICVSIELSPAEQIQTALYALGDEGVQLT